MIIVWAIMLGGWLKQLASEAGDIERAWLWFPIPIKAVAYGIASIAILVGNSTGAKPFIYFQF
jgi:hypothetical protein